MAGLGPTEIIIIVLLIVLLFGAKKLPELARSVGRSARILKSEVKEMNNDDAQANNAQAPQQRQIEAQKREDDDFWNAPENQPNYGRNQQGEGQAR